MYISQVLSMQVIYVYLCHDVFQIKNYPLRDVGGIICGYVQPIVLYVETNRLKYV